MPASEREARRQHDVDIRAYNQRFSKQFEESEGFLSRAWNNVVLTVRTMRAVEFLPILHKLLVLLSFVLQLVYVLSPIDLLPENAFGLLGFIDDVIVVVVLLVITGVVIRSMHGG